MRNWSHGFAARAAALGLLLAACLGGCAQTEQEEQPSSEPETEQVSLTPQPQSFALPYYPAASLNPVTGDNRTNLVLAGLVYQGLFELDNTFTPHQVLCAGSTVSEDGLTWTFSLNAASFSNGTALTAAHVADSLELARTSALYSARLSQVQSIRAGEDNTVTVTLRTPNGNLPALLDIPVILDPGNGGLPLGTGPYAFAEDSGPLRLVRCSGAPETAPETIELVPVDGGDDLIYAFDAGEISMVASDLTGSNALGYSAGYEAFDYPTTTMLYVGFRASGGACRDVLVRQAFSLALDRETVTDFLLAGHGESTCLPVSPSCQMYQEEREQESYDPVRAAALLEQAGYTADEDGLLRQGRSLLTVTMIVNTDNSFKLTVADYVAQQLTDLGVSVELQKLPWDDYLSALERGKFDLYLAETTLTADFDLTQLLSRSGTLNYGGYSSGEMETLLTGWNGAAGEERTQAADALFDLFQADAPFAPICFKNHSILIRWGAVSGLEPTRQNAFYQLENLRFSAVT